MEKYKALQFDNIVEADIEQLAPIMKRAFDEDSKIHLGVTGGPPGYDDGSFLRKFAFHESATAYKIFMDGKIIGAIILWINEDKKEGFLGNIFIDTGFENMGIGQIVWEFVEHKFSNIIVWRTETPAFSRRNHNFYVNKLGFHIVKIQNPKSLHDGSFVFEKRL